MVWLEEQRAPLVLAVVHDGEGEGGRYRGVDGVVLGQERLHPTGEAISFCETTMPLRARTGTGRPRRGGRPRGRGRGSRARERIRTKQSLRRRPRLSPCARRFPVPSLFGSHPILECPHDPVRLLAAAVAAAADPNPRTLRLDYFHTGSAADEHFARDGVVLEGPWPGTRPARSTTQPRQVLLRGDRPRHQPRPVLARVRQHLRRVGDHRRGEA